MSMSEVASSASGITEISYAITSKSEFSSEFKSILPDL